MLGHISDCVQNIAVDVLMCFNEGCTPNFTFIVLLCFCVSYVGEGISTLKSTKVHFQAEFVDMIYPSCSEIVHKLILVLILEEDGEIFKRSEHHFFSFR